MAIERIQRALTLRASRAQVFALVSDPLRTPEWLAGVRSVRLLTPGPIRPGSETLSQVTALGREWEARGRCIMLQPPERIVIETTLGPGLKSRSDSLIESVSETESILRAELSYQRPGGPVALLLGALGVRESIERDFDQSLTTLKRLIDAGG